MTSASPAPRPGGFLPPPIPTPPPAAVNCPPTGNPILPQPRSNPLRPGSAKESGFIDYVDRKLLGISRRYEKRFNADFEDEAASGIQGRGYESYAELARDLEGVIDVVWVSGTRTDGHWTHTYSWPVTKSLFSFASDAVPAHHCINILYLSCILPIFPPVNLSSSSQA